MRLSQAFLVDIDGCKTGGCEESSESLEKTVLQEESSPCFPISDFLGRNPGHQDRFPHGR